MMQGSVIMVNAFTTCIIIIIFIIIIMYVNITIYCFHHKLTTVTVATKFCHPGRRKHLLSPGLSFYSQHMYR